LDEVGVKLDRRQLLALLLAAPLGCSSDQALVPIGGRSVDARSIDAEPLALLPSGALLLGRLDAEALFRSSLGNHMAQIVSLLLPIGAESGFSPARDVKRVYGAAYAMQGADFAAVMQGTFNVAAMEQAAKARAATPSGALVVETPYAGYGIYTVGNIGFSILTANTVLTGNETGMRRALDRLRYGELDEGLPGWMLETFADARAAFAVAGDVARQGAVAAAQERLPFVDGLERVRALGNFEAPGMNIVGNLSYRDEQAAAQGAITLREVKKLAYFITLLANLGVGGASVPDLVTQQEGTHVSFATTVDTSLATMLLQLVSRLLQPGSTTLW
jgi:hypothetical protein